MTAKRNDYPASKFPVFMDEVTSAYGVDVNYGFPGTDSIVTVAQDVYGEKEPRMQLLIFPAGDSSCTSEPSVCLRFDLDGNLEEIVVPEKPWGDEDIKISTWDDEEASEWLVARDGR